MRSAQRDSNPPLHHGKVVCWPLTPWAQTFVGLGGMYHGCTIAAPRPRRNLSISRDVSDEGRMHGKQKRTRVARSTQFHRHARLVPSGRVR
jgi:hypothetical protein